MRLEQTKKQGPNTGNDRVTDPNYKNHLVGGHVDPMLGNMASGAIVEERNKAITSFVDLLARGVPIRLRMPPVMMEGKPTILDSHYRPTRYQSVDEWEQDKYELQFGEMKMRQNAVEWAPPTETFANKDECLEFWRGGAKADNYLSHDALKLMRKVWEEFVGEIKMVLLPEAPEEPKVVEPQEDEEPQFVDLDNMDQAVNVLGRPQVDAPAAHPSFDVPSQPTLGEALGQIEQDNLED